MKKLTGCLAGLLLVLTLSGCQEGYEKPVNMALPENSEVQMENEEVPAETFKEEQEPKAEEPSEEEPKELEAETQEPEVLEEDINEIDEPEPVLADILVEEKEDLIDNNKLDKVMVELPEEVIAPAMAQTEAVDAQGSVSNKHMSWYFNRNKEHQPPTAQREFDITQYDAYYLGDIENKVVYLTFDEGYENGYTSQILDVLKEKDVKAAFFVTKPYITANPDLILRMVDEGHIVGNHSVTHSSMPSQTDEEIQYEIEETARAFAEITGVQMPKYFRPPAGEYSARTLLETQKLGYKTVFWSFAYKDWLVDEQPGKQAAYNTVMNDLHNGMVLLLHAVSQSNTEALPDIIDSFREHGYTFLTLDELDLD